MPYSLLADLVLVLHLAFVLFVLFGGLLALKWRGAVWFHLPAVAWGTFVECTGSICPLTPLENWLRTRSGTDSYEGDFLQRYALPLLYPEGLTHGVQLVFGVLVLAVNLGIYGWLWGTVRKR
jgi:hypothetical protein